jgi:hypothetical protein
VCYDCDGCRRDEYQDDRETEDSADLAPEVTKRVGNGPRVKERWDKNEEQYFWRERDLRQSRDEREKEPTHHEDRCIGHPESLGDEAEPRGDGKEKQNELEGGHGTIISETSEVSTLLRRCVWMPPLNIVLSERLASAYLRSESAAGTSGYLK